MINGNMSDDDIHEIISNIAKGVSIRLHSVVQINGVINLYQKNVSDFLPFMAKTIIGQQLSNKVANSIWNKILSLCNSENTTIIDLFSNHSFGSQLRQCGVSSRKMKAIFGLATAINSEELEVRNLYSANKNQVREVLSKYWGIGNWSADMCSIFLIGMPDVFPDTDGAIKRGVREISLLTYDEDWVRLFKPYRSYLCLHIWKAIDNQLL